MYFMIFNFIIKNYTFARNETRTTEIREDRSEFKSSTIFLINEIFVLSFLFFVFIFFLQTSFELLNSGIGKTLVAPQNFQIPPNIS